MDGMEKMKAELEDFLEGSKMKLKFIVMEYIPSAMDENTLCPARIDGHYLEKADAEGVAAWWAENPMHEESRIVVAEIVAQPKKPRSWADG